jgi:hypothetical protein
MQSDDFYVTLRVKVDDFIRIKRLIDEDYRQRCRYRQLRENKGSIQNRHIKEPHNIRYDIIDIQSQVKSK